MTTLDMSKAETRKSITKHTQTQAEKKIKIIQGPCAGIDKNGHQGSGKYCKRCF